MGKNERAGSGRIEEEMGFEAILTLLAGEDREVSRDEEIAQARRDLDEALASLRLARAAWTSAQTIDLDALMRALDLAERQLDGARMRLHRALTRGK